MKKLIVSVWLLTLVSVFGQTNFSFPFLVDLSRLPRDEAKVRGQLAALNDFSNGVYRIETYGIAACTETKQQAYLREHYGVNIYPVAGCMVSSGLLGYVDGYNDGMRKLLIQKYGYDIFEEAGKVVLAKP